jgi:hypothetical protein
MQPMNRRSFLLGAGGAMAAGANDRINVGVAGVRSRGREHISIFGTLPNSRVAAVCDIDQA